MSTTTIPQHDTAYDPPLTPQLFFGPGLVATIFLHRLAQSAHRATTRALALDALIVALRPVIAMALERAIPVAVRHIPGDQTLVELASADLRQVLPTLRVASADDLIVRVAHRARAVATAAVPTVPRPTTAHVPQGRHLLSVLPPHVAFALLCALYPALDARMMEMLTRMTHPGAAWDRVAQTLGTSAHALRREYTAARALAEDRIVDEIVRRQPWPTVTSARASTASHVA